MQLLPDPTPELGDGIVTPERIRVLTHNWAVEHSVSSSTEGLVSAGIELLEARAGWAEKAMDLASRLVSNILNGQPTTDPDDLFVVEFRKACDGYRAAIDKGKQGG
jgi:hypothetical protein